MPTLVVKHKGARTTVAARDSCSPCSVADLAAAADAAAGTETEIADVAASRAETGRAGAAGGGIAMAGAAKELAPPGGAQGTFLNSNFFFHRGLEMMRRYREEHGDCNFPSLYHGKPLGCWADWQRACYRDLREGKPSPMTLDRVEALEALGFDWNPRANPKPRSAPPTSRNPQPLHEENWRRRLEELKRYQEDHGHINVPSQHPGGLYGWMTCQRNHHKEYQEGTSKRCHLTEERIAALEALGFEWVSNYQTVQDQNWNKRLEELTAYKKVVGHCNVPQNYRGNLGKWVNRQRNSYRKVLEGKRIKGLNADRIAALEQIGFVWNVGSGRTAGKKSLTKAKRHQPEAAAAPVPSGPGLPAHGEERYHQHRIMANSVLPWKTSMRPLFNRLQEGANRQPMVLGRDGRPISPVEAAAAAAATGTEIDANAVLGCGLRTV